MPGDFLRRQPQITMAQFHAFRDERPKEEKWELIDGVPMMMPPPTLIHQRVAFNLMLLLNERLAAAKPEWSVSQESGLLLPGDDKYNPEPDVVVIDTAIELAQRYAERFYFVAEVLSESNRPELRPGSDKPEVLGAKVAYYRNHEHCRAILVIEQNSVGAELHARGPAGTWSCAELEQPEDLIDIPDIGSIGRLGDLYRTTPLDPFRVQ